MKRYLLALLVIGTLFIPTASVSANYRYRARPFYGRPHYRGVVYARPRAYVRPFYGPRVYIGPARYPAAYYGPAYVY